MPVRVYRGDWKLIVRTALARTGDSDRRVTVPDVIHDLCKQLRDKERGNGT